MTKKQTRKSISVRGTTYAKVKAYADKMGRSVSDVAETALTVLMNSGPAMDSIVAKMREVPFTDLAQVTRETKDRVVENQDKTARKPSTLDLDKSTDVLGPKTGEAVRKALRAPKLGPPMLGKALVSPANAIQPPGRYLAETDVRHYTKPLDQATVRTVAQDIAQRRAARPESSAANVPDRTPAESGETDHRRVRF